MKRIERGFTLIELMVALVVSALLVGMILAIFSRMSLAYRGQQQIAGVQQVLAAARAMIELDAKQAGLQMPQGFKFANDSGSPPAARSPIRVVNDSSTTGPDQVSFYYADPTTQARVTAAVVGPPWPTPPAVTVDSSAGFAVGDRVVLSTLGASIPNPAGGADLAVYDACVLEIASIPVANTITFSTVVRYGNRWNC